MISVLKTPNFFKNTGKVAQTLEDARALRDALNAIDVVAGEEERLRIQTRINNSYL